MEGMGGGGEATYKVLGRYRTRPSCASSVRPSVMPRSDLPSSA